MPEVSVEAQQGSLEARARGPIFPSGRVLYSREGMEGAPARYRHRHLIAALNACMMVGYVALCTLQGIALEKFEIQTEGYIDLRGFLGLDDTIPAGYDRWAHVPIIRIFANPTPSRSARNGARPCFILLYGPECGGNHSEIA